MHFGLLQNQYPFSLRSHAYGVGYHAQPGLVTGFSGPFTKNSNKTSLAVMRVSSITDIIFMKLFRTKQIEDNQGVMLVSELLICQQSIQFKLRCFLYDFEEFERVIALFLNCFIVELLD